MDKVVERITFAGEPAVARFRELTPNISIPPNPDRTGGGGGYRVVVDDQVYYIDIKRHRANQVRPIKFRTVAVWMEGEEEESCWMVIPPLAQVRLARGRERGQHTRLAYECMTISETELESAFFCSDEELETEIAEACRLAKRCEPLRRAMENLANDIGVLKEEADRAVDAFTKPDLGPQHTNCRCTMPEGQGDEPGHG